MENAELDLLVVRAREGDRAALEALIQEIQDRVYRLALRMLWHPEDAADATQEILIRVVTNLGSYRAESAFTTWVFRVASNYLVTTRKRRAEQVELTFERFGEQLDQGLSEHAAGVAEDVEARLLIEEVKIGCTHGMLLCLDRPHRLAYVLGEIFELSGPEAAEILEISPAAFRKRLSRARHAISHFMHAKCGIVNSANPCRCARRVETAIEAGRVDPKRLLFARQGEWSDAERRIEETIGKLESARRAAALYRSHPEFAAPGEVAAAIRDLLAFETPDLATPS